VYEEPRTVFVADFLGVSNLLVAEGVGRDGSACMLKIGDRTFRAEKGETGARGELKAMIRPERIVLEPQGASGANRLPGMVERSVFLGSAYELHVRVLGGELLRLNVTNEGNGLGAALEQGSPVTLHLPPDALRVLTPDAA
jgi:ABC-type Fe3+/spermidine/putrescine transport system ATPase subunit